MVRVYRYDPQTDVWTAVAPMSISRDAVGVCLLGDRLYAVGGYDGQVYLNTVEAYDPQTNEWAQVYTQKHVNEMVHIFTHIHTIYMSRRRESVQFDKLCSRISCTYISN